MSTHDLLDIIGEAQDPYILSAIHTRQKRRKAPGFSRRILIAAILITLLLLTACAAKYVGSLFVTYFQEDGRHSLSQSQVDYIESNTQPSFAQPIVTDAANGYDLRIHSALTDGKVAYITMTVTAPEGVSLEGGEVRFYENPLLIPDKTQGLFIAPDGSSPDAMCDYETIDDGDGLANTASIMFKVYPFKEDETLNPFDGSIHWTVRAGGFCSSIYSPETGNYTREELETGTWEFDLEFDKIDTREVEFVAEPIPVMTSDWIRTNYIHENQLISFTLSGLGRGMTLTKDTINGEKQDIGNVTIVMKDGTSQTLICLTCPNTGTAPLSTPIVLEEVDHVLLVNTGTKLYPIP